MKSKTPIPPKTTYEKVLKLIQENAKDRKESAKDRKAMREESKNTGEYVKAFCRSMDETMKDLRASTKAMQKELGGVGNSNGAVAESYFVNSFTQSMQFAGQEYDSISPYLKKKVKSLNLRGEYDLVLYNCTSVVIIEVKYSAERKHVERLLKKMPIFKQLFPEYANFDFYLGLAALHFEGNTESEAIDHGIAVIKQVGDNMVINDEHLKVF